MLKKFVRKIVCGLKNRSQDKYLVLSEQQSRKTNICLRVESKHLTENEKKNFSQSVLCRLAAGSESRKLKLQLWSNDEPFEWLMNRTELLNNGIWILSATTKYSMNREIYRTFSFSRSWCARKSLSASVIDAELKALISIERESAAFIQSESFNPQNQYFQRSV